MQREGVHTLRVHVPTYFRTMYSTLYYSSVRFNSLADGGVGRLWENLQADGGIDLKVYLWPRCCQGTTNFTLARAIYRLGEENARSVRSRVVLHAVSSQYNIRAYIYKI